MWFSPLTQKNYLIFYILKSAKNVIFNKNCLNLLWLKRQKSEVVFNSTPLDRYLINENHLIRFFNFYNFANYSIVFFYNNNCGIDNNLIINFFFYKNLISSSRVPVLRNFHIFFFFLKKFNFFNFFKIKKIKVVNGFINNFNLRYGKKAELFKLNLKLI
jgi:hypothetical protein